MSLKEIRLTQLTKSSGWAAKIGPETLTQVLSNLPVFTDEKLVVGLGKADDAAVYCIDEKTCIIQTLDFFTPIVDDPYTYGQIAAANSLSDVYAMGGKPVLALNIVGFPNCLSENILSEILRGGADKVKEAGAVLAGGHSIQDEEPKYGLSVMGTVSPEKILRNGGAKVGDYIIISKPLGLGIINTAIKGELASDVAYKKAVEVMIKLNNYASEAAIEMNASSCTDVTGFGLFGHAIEMSENSDVTIELFMKEIPIIDETEEYASMGLIPGGAYKNRDYYKSKIKDNGFMEELISDICFDPQTSGGLLFSVAEINMETMKKYEGLKVIGRVIEKTNYNLVLV